MKLENIGEIIASRTFVLQRENEPTSEVMCCWAGLNAMAGFLLPSPDQGSRSRGGSFRLRSRRIQAIQLSISLLQFEVGMFQKEMNGNLSWEGGEVTDFGFPTVG